MERSSPTIALSVRLAHTADIGITFDGEAELASELVAYSDSDWSVGHSVTGWVLFLAEKHRARAMNLTQTARGVYCNCNV